MSVIPNKAKMLFLERNVDIPGLDRPSSAYDLGLYGELATAGRSVLVVTVICRMSFVNGSGPSLAWTPTAKTDFASGFKAVIMQQWSEQHVLRTVTPTALNFDQIAVVFEVQASEGLGASDHSHWNIAVTKIAPAAFNVSTTRDPLFAGIVNGSLELDSEDLTPVNKGAPQPQRAAAHEFGHMMGYKDEYVSADGSTPGVSGWTTDLGSVMNCGETVQPRHYIWFADWCNTQYRTLGNLTKKPIEWKVDGAVNMATARI